MGAFADFQKAVFAALNGDPALTALIGADKVFDDVPVQGETTSPALPYVVIADQTGEDNGASATNAANMTIDVHAWSRKPGRLQCLEMLDAIRHAIEGTGEHKTHAVANGVLVELHYESHQTAIEDDRETYRGTIRFAGFYHYG